MRYPLCSPGCSRNAHPLLPLAHLSSLHLLSSGGSSTNPLPVSHHPQHPLWYPPETTLGETGCAAELAIPFYTCPTGLSQQNLKKENSPSGLQWLCWPCYPGPDWMTLGPLGGISECSNSRTFAFLPWPLGETDDLSPPVQVVGRNRTAG